MTKKELLTKIEEEHKFDVSSDNPALEVAEGLLNYEAQRNPIQPAKRQVTIPWEEIESYVYKLLMVHRDTRRYQEIKSICREL